MKICYIISTCDKYIDNRVKYQMETFLHLLTFQTPIIYRQFYK
jgi:hypothetical protein